MNLSKSLGLFASLCLAATACSGPGGGGFASTCNNGVIDPGEICDGAQVGNNSCESAGFERGILVCNLTCTNYDYSGCSGGNPDVTIGGDISGALDAGGSDAGASADAPASDTLGFDTSGSETGPPPTGDAGSGSGAPVFLSLAANTTTINAGESLVITAVLTDPDGIDDLIGGNLVAPDSGASYGAFATSASEGSYTLSLGWGELATVQAIEAPETGIERTFRAVFYDQSGAEATQDLTVTLRCDANNDRVLCNSECADLATDSDHCGACGSPVPNTADFFCEGGAPICYGFDELNCGDTCEPPFAQETCGSCDNNCLDIPAFAAASDRRCEDGACEIRLYSFEVSTCDTECGAVGGTCAEAYTIGAVSTIPLGCDQGSNDLRCWCDVSAGGTVTPDPTTPITDIQSSSDSVACDTAGNQEFPPEVIVEGTVAVDRFAITANIDGYILSDGTQAPFSGIVLEFPATETYSFDVGEQIRVTGTHTEWYCQTQLLVSAAEAIGTLSAPAPVNVDAVADLEPYEGMVVELTNVQVTGHTMFNEAETDKGVLIDDAIMGATFQKPDVGATVPVLRGVVLWAFDTYRVAPRSEGDY